jgi:hypothetical protein
MGHESCYFSILSKDAVIPLIRAELNPLCSISLRPTIVHPLKLWHQFEVIIPI